MIRTLSSKAVDFAGREIRLNGWIKIRRDHGKLIFLDLRDRDGIVQIVVNPHISEEAYKVVQELRPEFAVEITGKVNKRPENAINKDLLSGTVEVEATAIKILSKAETLPFDMGEAKLNLELPTLLDNRSLTLRHKSIFEIFKVQEEVARAFRKAAEKLGCTEIFVPAISASATEGGAEVFKVKYYDYDAYLTQSPQLYKQIMIGVFERVYTISHAYRAEPSVTTRHLSESVQLDIEIGFIDTFEELLDAIELVGTSIVSDVSKNCAKILASFGIEKALIPTEIPRLTLKEAQEIIYKFSNGQRDCRAEQDLNATDEKLICEWAKKEKGSDFVTITHFPTKKRAFYSLPDPKNPELSLSYDLLFRGLEILSGSQRVNDYDQLLSIMKERKLNPKSFPMYLQAFKYGIPPEGGFSFGLERLTMKLLELQNIREASLFPRDTERVDERLSNLK
ncbi:MAG: aspartate--tRNA(Asn) ligase [Patescibacteria group bacterium]|nr:aspartate--tRNA(Asn) ligase [Patescibacteria group bacterium]